MQHKATQLIQPNTTQPNPIKPNPIQLNPIQPTPIQPTSSQPITVQLNRNGTWHNVAQCNSIQCSQPRRITSQHKKLNASAENETVKLRIINKVFILKE